ncbi:dephospho-CoA kinase [Silvimonas iriomotensis]|uniref:Dephospho-CoA kinase n=1 Tax=Silvimonas iriomotensis TaxID=449662 RepID=A0ABQ2PA12_9NEIS|nr:dephospho-CoA kinase [Silvimonas iriomotensis]GGP21475.1 dephospho-CoA kinase [Silvimonas iriomotensis]
MRVIGLTGGAGSGKSTAARLFAELGAGVIDTDDIAHALSRPPSAALDEVRQVFGDDFIAADGTMDRARMRELVFADPAARARLEAIFHPRILDSAQSQLRALEHRHDYTLLVVPLLFETGNFLPLVSSTLVVDCPVDQQRARLAERGLDPQAIDRLLAAQLSREARLARADAVIDNNSTLEALTCQVRQLHAQFSAG